ncbi:globin domain-containing protein [Rhodococcus sp. 27YEA15]|uniref:globin domain-containing protein n=1 Tax=Rhodococcus sp. 27YEA15 TaxID=3156259 RepID=UPI003C7CF43E
MDSQAISLVRSSFKAVAAVSDGPERLARSFYSILFACSPETREFFPAAMDVQRDRLVAAIAYVVDRLDETDAILEYLAQLGRDHRKYGVTDEHYTAVGNALISALEDFGAELWTEELDSAWRDALAVISAAMMDAANAQDGPPAFTATVIECTQVIKGVAVVRLQLREPFTYRAGQYVSVQVAARPRMWRYLSPATPCDESGVIEFHIRAVSGGWVSPAMVTKTAVGDTWVIGSPIGSLGLPDDDRDLLMIASGTGISALRAQILQLVDQGNTTRKVDVFYSGEYPCDLYDLPLLWKLADKNSWLTVVPVSEEAENPWWHTDEEPLPPIGMKKRITGKVGKIVTASGDWSGRDIQLVGSESMVNSTNFRLRAVGIDVSTVRSDPAH